VTGSAGVRAIAGAARDAAIDQAVAAAEQLELLPSRFKPGTRAHAEAVAASARRKAGRPVGALNLATRQRIELVQRLFGDPLMESARWLLHSPDAMARELGCTTLEAFDRQEEIRKDLRRFMYAPLAPVDGDGNAVAPTFNLTIGARRAGADGRAPWDYEGGPALDITPQETQQNQALPQPPDAVSHGAASHEEGK
jgi:hypothetical protein